MSLLPENESELLDDYLECISGDNVVQPSKTYRFNFDTGRIDGMIDEKDAVKQFIRKAIVTERAYWRIYTDDYGSELNSLLGTDVTDGFLQSEIPRMVSESIEYDDRIVTVDDMTAFRDGDAVFISAEVATIYGTVDVEVVI